MKSRIFLILIFEKIFFIFAESFFIHIYMTSGFFIVEIHVITLLYKMKNIFEERIFFEEIFPKIFRLNLFFQIFFQLFLNFNKNKFWQK